MGRVVVTGLGCLTSVGKDPLRLWDSLMKGRSNAGPVHSFDTSGMERHIGCEIPDWRPRRDGKGYMDDLTCRARNLASYAARQALEDAGVPRALYERLSICVGTTMSELFNGVNSRTETVRVRGLRPVPNSYASIRVNCIATHLAEELGARGTALVIPTACAAGNYAIGYAHLLISMGRAPVVLAGGSDAFSRIAFIGFSRLRAMSPDMCRPFDRDRQGLLVGEGSAFLLLEDEKSARKRRAKIYAEILGCGLSCDGFHIAAPHPQGLGAALAIQRALKQARVSEERVVYISAHGTGTLANDRIETIAIKRVFGRGAFKIPVSSIKALLGHSMGAASAIEAVVSALVLMKRYVPPTWNYRTPDPACDLDYVPNEPRSLRKPGVVLSNSFAFGGNNACLALGPYR